MRFNIQVFLICFIAISDMPQLHGQANQIVPVAPEAAALAKSVNYNVNNNTGIPSINIPFYEIKVGNLVLPVNFIYQGGGFKINEHATPEGLGWSLGANIQITRTINGLDDFIPGVGYIANTLMKGFSPSSSNSNYPLGSISPWPYKNKYDLAAGIKDGEPDKFNYSLLGKSGSFYFMKNANGSSYTIVPVPYDNIQITFNSGQFIITDTDGTIYYFGVQGTGDLFTLQAQGKEVTGQIDQVTGTCMNCKITGWKCMHIESNISSDSIDFIYQPQTVVKYRSYSDRIEYYDNESPCNIAWDGGYYHSNEIPLNNYTTYENILQNIPFYRISSPKYMVRYGNGQPIFHVPSYDNSKTMTDKTFKVNSYGTGSSMDIAGLAISQIQFRGGKIEVNGVDRLSSIDVLDDNDNVIKSAQLYQSYTNAVYLPESKYYNGFNYQGTSYLDSIHIVNGGNTYERYAFLYNDKFCYGNHLKGHDAWGYPNASTVEIAYANNTPNNILSIPSKEVTQGRYYFDIQGGCSNYIENILLPLGGDDWAEAPNEQSAKKGTLKRIIYPTGGFVDFDWESNKYLETFDNGNGLTQKIPRLAGGLRIRTISYFDGTTLLPNRQKYYRYGEIEDGTGVLIHRPGRPMNQGIYHYEAVDYSQQIAYLSAPTNPPCYNKGCLSIKTVESKTTYMPASALNYTYENGAPIYYNKVSIYKKDFGVQSGKIVYEYYPPNHFFTYPAFLQEGARITGTPLSYQQTDGLMGVEKSECQYTYDSKKGYQLVHSKNLEYTRFLKDMQVHVAFAFFHVLYELVEGNYQNVNDWELYNNSSNFSPSPNSVENEYVSGEYGIPSGKLLLNSVIEKTFEDSNVLTETTLYHYNNPGYLQPSSIDISNSKGLNITKTIKYPYDLTGIYSQMTSANMIDIPIEITETNTTSGKEISKMKTNYGAINEGSGFFAPVSMESSYGGSPLTVDVAFDKYDKYGNTLQRTLRNGIPVSYLWGYNNLYPVAELKGVEFSQIPANFKSNIQIDHPTSDESLRTLLSSLPTSFSQDKQIRTYTYKRLIGLTSQTSANNYTTYYEYDSIGRLKNLKDNLHISLKSFSYHMTGPTANSLTAWYVNYPMMETHANYPGDNYNYIVPGGKYSNYSQQSANMAAEGDLVDVYDPPPTTSTPDSSIRVAVKLKSFSYSLNPDLKLDFLQNGSIVASAKVPFSNDPENIHYYTLYLKPGDYQLSFRISADAHYSRPLIYRLIAYDVNGENYSDLTHGDAVTLMQDKHYLISVF